MKQWKELLPWIQRPRLQFWLGHSWLCDGEWSLKSLEVIFWPAGYSIWFLSSSAASESLPRTSSGACVSTARSPAAYRGGEEQSATLATLSGWLWHEETHRISLEEENPGPLHDSFLWSASWAGISQSVLFYSSTKVFEPSCLVVSAQGWTHQLRAHLAPRAAITSLHEPICYLNPFWNRAHVNKHHSVPPLGVSAPGRWLRMGRADGGKVFLILPPWLTLSVVHRSV